MAEANHFILKPTINAISDILNMKNCKVSGIDGVPTSNFLSVTPGHMDLEFDAIYRDVPACAKMDDLPELILETDIARYKVPQYGSSFEGRITVGTNEVQHFDIRFNKLTQTTIVEGKNYYWRFIYPMGNHDWFLKIQGLNYADDYGLQHYSKLLFAELEGHKMTVLSSRINENYWLIINTAEAISYEEMDHRVMSITTALGFVLGIRYGDYCFHVACDEPSFSQIVGIEALTLKKTKCCPYKILNPNSNIVELWLHQFEYQQYAIEEVKRLSADGVRWYYEEDAMLSIDAFSKLAQLCYISNDMLLATSMLIDGSLMNIEYMKPFFHVTLETITSSLTRGNNTTSPPMPQEDFKNEVLPLLLNALDSVPNISEDARRIFKSRIEHQLNKETNEDKMTICFEKCGYSLTPADKEAIKHRNVTLHGHLASGKKLLRLQQNEMLAMGLRLHKLCSILLLKEAGFTGKVLNNEVLFGIEEACRRQEPVYIVI